MGNWSKQRIVTVAVSAAIVIFAICYLCRGCRVPEEVSEPPVKLLYGIPYEQYEIVDDTVRSGQTLSGMLGNRGVSPQRIDKLGRTPNQLFDPRMVLVGQPYQLFLSDTSRTDSISEKVLEYMVYKKNEVDYLIFDLREDSITVSLFSKPVTIERMRRTGHIESSLWNAMIDGGMSPGLTVELSEIYAWSIDFFAIHPGDEFTLVYDERTIDDSVSIGTGRIWGATFTHLGKTYWAIPFKQNGKISYWDEKGNSLRKSLLKAPLKFSRISSRFSNARRHPVLRIVRPHHGVDYAAPSGTPVYSVADGTIVRCGWGGGGGNTIYIKHARGLQSGYLHLRSFARGMRVGKRVSQGELIGYVGSTGLSTGPHLDFRIWQNGKPIDPLKVPTEPAEPIAAANRADFDLVRERIMAEVEGRLVDSLRVTDLDTLDYLKLRYSHADTAQHP